MANLRNRYIALCWRPVTHAQTRANYSALYRFGRLSQIILHTWEMLSFWHFYSFTFYTFTLWHSMNFLAWSERLIYGESGKNKNEENGHCLSKSWTAIVLTAVREMYLLRLCVDFINPSRHCAKTRRDHSRSLKQSWHVYGKAAIKTEQNNKKDLTSQ